jgi:hypothetical protein
VIGASLVVVALAMAGLVAPIGQRPTGAAEQGLAASAPCISTGSCSSAAGSSRALATGRWKPFTAPPHMSESNLELAAWTGRYVIAWGGAGQADNGSSPSFDSRDGWAFEPATGAWRQLPPAPTPFTVESTISTGHNVLVWGSAPAAPFGSRPSNNLLLSFDPTTWRWQSLAAPPLPGRSGAQVVWTGTTLVAFGGQGGISTLLDGASFDPQTNRWSQLPAIPNFRVPAGSNERPVGVAVAWGHGSLYVWITREVTRKIPNGGETKGEIQALRWQPRDARWHRAPAPPTSTPLFGAMAVPAGPDLVLLDGTFCLPDESCPAAMGAETTGATFHVRRGKWSTVPSAPLAGDSSSFVWTGRTLAVITSYLTDSGYQVGGSAAAFDPGRRTWTALPQLPVPVTPPSGPVLTGSVWTGSQLITSNLVLVPGRGGNPGSSVPTSAGASTLPRCPPITFPSLVGGTFCGPAPGPGNGHGAGGSCRGDETAPPCGAGLDPGRYYPYTLLGACANTYLDGRWWKNELPGGSGFEHVWVSVSADGRGAGWISREGNVDFTPSASSNC